MRRIGLYLLNMVTVCVMTALLGGCTVTSTNRANANESSGAAALEETVEKVDSESEEVPEGGEEETAEAEKKGDAEEKTDAQPAVSEEADAAKTEPPKDDSSGTKVIAPEVAEGHVIAPQSSDEALAEVVNVNFELTTVGDKVFAVITGVNGKDEVVWQNMTPEFDVGTVAPLTPLMVLADSYFYVENGDIVRLNKETGVEYWRNTDFGGRVTDLGWAQLGETFYFAGAEGPELFIMSMHGQTIKSLEQINSLFAEPYRLRLQNGRIVINYGKTPTGKTALISLDPEDYSYAVIVDAEDVPTVTDPTLYYANVRSSLGIRSGPGADYATFSALESDEEMYVLRVEGDYAYVWAKTTGMVGYATGKYVLISDGTHRNALEIAAQAAPIEGGADNTAAPQEAGAENAAQAAEAGADNAAAPAAGEAQSPAGEAAKAEGDGEVWYVDVASSLYLREEPDYSSDSVASLEPMTELILLGYEDGVAHVRVKATGEEGYVSPKFITNDVNDLNYQGR